MNRAGLITLVLITVLPQIAVAAPGKKGDSSVDGFEQKKRKSGKGRREKTASGKRIVYNDENTIDSTSSEAKRQDKALSLKVEAIGFTPSVTFGAGGGYFINPDIAVEFHYSKAHEIFDLGSATTMFVGVRNFWGNSFNTVVGLAKRDVELKSEDYTLDLTNESSEFQTSSRLEAKTSSLGVQASIGNMWQWDYFMMGVDWIGFFLPLSSSGDSKPVITGEDVEQSRIDAFQSDIDASKASSAMFMRFYLGVSF